ncbi:hypothetical protein M0R45_036878 [Rubus argutus]|uniref:F-box domain-containing protein n=1 Tax=Rubus argutus TaxID=59490 RepID=A0AAW1VY96_RUBAR
MEITQSRCSMDEYLIVEIMSRLPVKSLMRFSCVSKQWYSLTRNSYLINTHLRRSDSNLSLLSYTTILDRQLSTEFGISMLDDEADLVSLDLSFSNNYTCSESVKLVGSSNGLLCLVTEAHTNGAKSLDGVDIIIWNPATRRFRTIPKPVLPENINDCTKTGAYGFGFSDDNTNDYKLVGIFGNQVQVFSRSTNSWRQVEGKGFPSYQYYHRSEWTSLNGVLYWMAMTMTDGCFESFILSFNLCDEAFDVIQLPSTGVVWNSRLLSWKNSLACLCESNLQVWAKTTDDNTTLPWTKQFSFDSPTSSERIIGIWKDQVLILRLTSINGLFLYDPKTKKRGKQLPKRENYSYFDAGLVNYVESLVLV